MLVDASSVGQGDSRTGRGGHVRATGWRDRYRRMTWVLVNATCCAIFGGNTIYPVVLILLPWNTSAKVKPSWNQEETRQF